MKSCINVFTKCPFTGNPKTRLSSIFSRDEREFLCKIMIENMMKELSCFDRSKNKVNVHIYPNHSHKFFNKFENDFKCQLYSQQGENLSQRILCCIFFTWPSFF